MDTREETTVPIKCKSQETCNSLESGRSRSTRQRFKCGICNANGFVVFRKYGFVTGSDVDYSGKFVHQRGACLLGEAGGEYDTDIDTDINEKIKIKSEM